MSHEYEDALAAATRLDEVGDIVRQAARRVTGADGATFVLRDGDLCFYADEDAIAPLWKGQRFPMRQCISGWAMLNRQSVAIADIELDERIPIEAYRPTFVRSLIMVPINRARPVAAIGAYWSWTGVDSAAPMAELDALADATAIAIDRIGFENAPWAPNFALGRGTESRQLQTG
jgi:GAF domain-containing protein